MLLEEHPDDSAGDIRRSQVEPRMHAMGITSACSDEQLSETSEMIENESRTVIYELTSHTT